MQYGFVINHDACIGCHACTTACKAENDVPVGSFRTSVKYVEVGKFPYVRRHFLVQRCNHCTDAPCIKICPVNALSKRPDGIVDIDRDTCIGCRACMQACPYDALYLNDDLGAVEKCHFCAHRIDKGLSPACVNVCPVGAIVPGDLHDPNSPASRLKAEHETKARRKEQKTGPNVHYIGAHDLALEPGMIERPSMYLWSDRPAAKPEAWPESLPLASDAKVVLDAGHKVEWGWPVSLYLLTKGIAAGVAMVAPVLPMMGSPRFDPWIWPEIVTLFFTLVTLFLLVEDLKKPLHFYKLFTRPNMGSWLVKGGLILTAFSICTLCIMVIDYARPAMGHQPTADSFISAFRWINALLGLATAGYTAFLFKQCKGRDLWEHRLLLPGLLFQALFCGALFAGIARTFTSGEVGVGLGLFLALAIVGQAGFLFLHLRMTHGRQETANAYQAAAFAHSMRVGGQRLEMLGMKLVAGGQFFVIMSALTGNGLGFMVLGTLLACAGIFLMEHVFIRAGQLPPLS